MDIDVLRASHPRRAIARSNAATDRTVAYIISTRGGLIWVDKSVQSSHPGVLVRKYLVYKRAMTNARAMLMVA